MNFSKHQACKCTAYIDWINTAKFKSKVKAKPHSINSQQHNLLRKLI